MDTYLAFLLEEEMKRKAESLIETKEVKSHFPYLQTIEEFDFSNQPGLKEKEVISDSARNT